MAEVLLNPLRETVQGFVDFGFIAGDASNSFPPTRGAYQTYCNIWAGQGTPDSLANLTNPASFCAPYLEEQGRTFGQEEFPFQGGQCAAPYSVNITYDPGAFGAGSGDIVVGVTGPVESIEEVPGSMAGGETYYRVRIVHAGGTTNTAELTPDPGSLNYDLTRTDGQPDSCGNPDGQFVPGDGYEGEDYGNPVEYVDSQGNTNSISVGAPVVNEDGSISLPVTVNGDTLELGVPGASGGDSSQDFGPSEAGDPQLGEGDGGLEDIPPAPPGTVCIAIAVSILNIPDGNGFVSNTAPNRRSYAPLGNACLLLQSDDGSQYFGSDVVLYSERSLIAIPVEGLTIVGFRVNLGPGMSSSVTPLYRVDEAIEGNDG